MGAAAGGVEDQGFYGRRCDLTVPFPALPCAHSHVPTTMHRRAGMETAVGDIRGVRVTVVNGGGHLNSGAPLALPRRHHHHHIPHTTTTLPPLICLNMRCLRQDCYPGISFKRVTTSPLQIWPPSPPSGMQHGKARKQRTPACPLVSRACLM
jgi:hypothetical protein